MVGHEYNLTDVQMSNIRALYHVCITWTLFETVSLIKYDVPQLITSVGGGLTVCDGSVRILTQALQYQSENRLLLAISALNGNSTSPDVSQGEIRGVFEDLQIRLEENFTLTKEQQVCSPLSSPLYDLITSLQKNIRKLAQELIYQASRTGFKRLHLDVEVSCPFFFKCWC